MSTAYRLDEVCTVIMGQAPSGDAYNDEGNGWPLIAGAGDFSGSNPAPKKYTTAASKLSRPGDIILGIRASIGDTVLADGEYCLGRGVAALRPNDRVDRRFLWQWLTCNAPALAVKGRGATFRQVNREDIGEMPIHLPPRSEQRRIAQVLDHVDELRAKRREAVVLLERLNQSIFRSMFGNPLEEQGENSRRSLLEWVNPQRPITYGILKPGKDNPGGAPYVRVVDMKGGGIDASAIRRTTHEISHQYRRSLLKPGDILMSIRGHVGRLALVPEGLEGANITQDSARIAVAAESARYVVECLRTPAVQHWMARHTKGAAVKGINLGDVKTLKILAPPLDLQRSFSSQATIVDQIVSREYAHLAELDALFFSVQHRAFRGELWADAPAA